MKVLVVGCERSGTTAISALLAEGSGLSFLNDPPDSWYIYPLVRMVGLKGFTFSLIKRLWKYDIVKVPGFATILNELKRVHPKKFKVVYVVRDPRDTYAAIKERLEVNLAGSYLNIHFLKKTGKSPCENIAIRWSTYLEMAKEFQTRNPSQIMFVKYEDFLEDKPGVLKSISEFASVRIDPLVIKDKMDKQINKSWSNKIRGSKRYLKDLNEKEINIINEIAHKGIEEFNY